MDSTQLSTWSKQWSYGNFSEWHLLNDKAIQNAPSKKGTYVIRKAGGERFGRLRGESDIMYIGSTTRRLKKRLQQYLRPGPTQWTNQRIYKLLTKGYKLEFAWCLNDEPKILEHNLLRQYISEHDEFPPMNRADKAIKEAFD